MEKPDCDDGWLKYAHELDAALAVADFSKGARIVLHEVFAQIFGLAKLPTARLSPLGIAGRSGLQPPNVSRAIRELIDSHALRREPDGSYRFLKDYGAWTGRARGATAATPRLTEAEAVYCRNAPAVAKAYQHGYDETARIQRDNQSENTNGEIVSNKIRNRIPLDTKSYPVGYEIGPPPNNPPVGSEFENEGERARARDSAQSPPEAPDPAEINRVANAVDALFPQSHFGAKVGQFATMYPPAWILKACQAAAGSGKNVGWSYIHSILKRYQNQGGPDVDAPTSRGSSAVRPAALPPSVEQVRRERAEADRDRKPVETTPEEIARWKQWAAGSDATAKKIAEKCLANLAESAPKRSDR